MILGLKLKSIIFITIWSQIGAYLTKIIESDYWGRLWDDLQISGPSDLIKSLTFWVTGMLFYWVYKKFNWERYFKPFKND